MGIRASSSSFAGQNAVDYNDNCRVSSNDNIEGGANRANLVDNSNQNGMNNDPSLVELENLLNDFSEIVDGGNRTEDSGQDVIMNSESNNSTNFKQP